MTHFKLRFGKVRLRYGLPPAITDNTRAFSGIREVRNGGREFARPDADLAERVKRLNSAGLVLNCSPDRQRTGDSFRRLVEEPAPEQEASPVIQRSTKRRLVVERLSGYDSYLAEHRPVVKREITGVDLAQHHRQFPCPAGQAGFHGGSCTHDEAGPPGRQTLNSRRQTPPGEGIGAAPR